MRQPTDAKEVMVRKAFDLLIQLREKGEGPLLLSCAVAFLEMLARQSRSKPVPMVVSVRAVRLRKV